MPNILEDYLTRADLAKQIRKSERVLERWEQYGEGPPVTRIGRAAYYHIPAVKAWLASLQKAMPREEKRRRRARDVQPAAAA